MPPGIHPALLIALLLSGALWIGGYVVIGMLAHTATTVLSPDARVILFHALGRRYLYVGVPALLVAFATGAALLHDHPRDATLWITVVVCLGLLATLALGVVQARRMTGLRRRALASPADDSLAHQVTAAARRAAALRAFIGILSLALVVLAAFLAS